LWCHARPTAHSSAPVGVDYLLGLVQLQNLLTGTHYTGQVEGMMIVKLKSRNCKPQGHCMMSGVCWRVALGSVYSYGHLRWWEDACLKILGQELSLVVCLVCVVCSFTTLQGGRQHASLGSARCNQPIDLSGYQAALHDVCWVLA
jgi:hypothetical protein